jgi:hypothetical protein
MRIMFWGCIGRSLPLLIFGVNALTTRDGQGARHAFVDGHEHFFEIEHGFKDCRFDFLGATISASDLPQDDIIFVDDLHCGVSFFVQRLQFHIFRLFPLSLLTEGEARLDELFSLVFLSGPWSVVGRSVIVHADRDDLVLGGLKGTPEHEESLKTGNAGARLACAVIGIVSEI